MHLIREECNVQSQQGKIHEQRTKREIGEILKSNLRRIEVALNKQNKNRCSSCTLFKITFTFSATTHWALLTYNLYFFSKSVENSF